MPKAKGSGSGGLIWIAVVIAIVVLASNPKNIGGTLFWLTAVGLVVYLFRRGKKSPPDRGSTIKDSNEPLASYGQSRETVASSEPVRNTDKGEREFVKSASAQGAVKSSSGKISAGVDEDLVAASYHNPESSKSFRIPPAPAQFGRARWLSATESVEIAGVAISGGLIYVGAALKAASGIVDPCLIDPSKDVAKRADYTVREMGYWPSYSAISPTARRAYLNWLSTGRADPDADIGYVFIYFYGLERRAVFDAANDQAARADLPAIAAELRRLLAIYGPRSGSFQGYGTALLDWITLVNLPERSYLQPLPSSPRSYELPLYIRAALGQAAVDRVAISADLALAWIKLDPRSLLRTPTLRCAQEFNSLFKLKYLAAGDGLVLPRNRTKLKLVYRAASAGFRGVEEPRLTFGDIPDVSVLAAPFKKLHEITEAATNELEPLSRYLGRNPGARSTVEALLLLPVALWPDSAKRSIEALKERMDGGMVTMPFQELLGALGSSATLSRERTVALARILEGMSIGMEPDVLGGAKQPKPEDQVALFVTATDDLQSRDAPDYRLAALALQLAAAVATSDGDFGAKEISHLHQQIQSWSHLSPNNQRRLVAHLRLLMVAPPSLTALKKRLESLDPAARGSIASFVAAVAQSDGTVSPVEVRMLEKVYKVLGVDPQKVFSELHAAATGSEPAAKQALGEAKAAAGFTLDASRIAALQKDSEAVSAMLSTIFVEEAEMVEVAPTANAVPTVEQDSLLGLDEAHSSLARLLLSRPHWTKAELSDAALDLDLMLEGALEQLNDAAFDAHDMAFFEGDDPVEINLELREKLAA
ncbi:TerB N-terminal domain-containing protein [Cupriavidus sp. D384]|uniref:tellurite resistance TerB family protein n=1 Tax=Cupriavidus sp. D384 TaxID=1538095 RepID=UPI00082ADF8F|nr:TerB N-terminal domain-containing protein [Cupriavidus sp. D384]